VIWRIEAHFVQELFENNRHFFQALVVFNVVLYQFARCEPEMVLVFEDRARERLLFGRRVELLLKHQVLLFVSLVDVVVEGYVYLQHSKVLGYLRLLLAILVLLLPFFVRHVCLGRPKVLRIVLLYPGQLV